MSREAIADRVEFEDWELLSKVIKRATGRSVRAWREAGGFGALLAALVTLLARLQLERRRQEPIAKNVTAMPQRVGYEGPLRSGDRPVERVEVEYGGGWDF
jgi:hypothetical protein